MLSIFETLVPGWIKHTVAIWCVQGGNWREIQNKRGKKCVQGGRWREMQNKRGKKTRYRSSIPLHLSIWLMTNSSLQVLHVSDDMKGGTPTILYDLCLGQALQWGDWRTDGTYLNVGRCMTIQVVYYESRKWELQIRLMNDLFMTRWNTVHTPVHSEFCCLLWIVKSRAKDKTYIWISVRWKTTN